MKILLISDTHIHTWKSFNVQSSSLLSRQLVNQEDILANQVMEIADKNKVDMLIHGGDIYHEVGKVPVECLNIVHKFFNGLLEKNIIYHLIVTGNHDLIKREDGKWYHNITNLYENSITVEACAASYGIKLGIINFDTEVGYDKLVGYDLIVAHKTPVGASHGKFMFDDGVDWQRLAANNRLVFFGHIHQRQQLSDNCYVIGSPMHFNFGDVGDRGVYIIDTDLWSVEFIKLKYPEFRTVDSPEEVVDDYNYYRVMHGDGKESGNNVIVVHVPQVYEEKIKSINVRDILMEWLAINNKDKSYLDVIIDDVGKIESVVNVVNKLKLVSVSIKDFISIGIAEYDLHDGFILINGQSDGFSSNGSGKTALVDAIYWALFGKTTKGLVGDDVIRRGLKNCFVELTLVDNGNTYVINRSRKNGLSIRHNGVERADGLRLADAQELLLSILGFDENLYMASCYFSQENLLMFTDMSDTDRINIVSQLLGFHVYDAMYDLMFNRIKDCNVKLVELSSSVNNIKFAIEKTDIKIAGVGDVVKSEEESIRQCNHIIEQCQHEIDDIASLINSENNIKYMKIDYMSKLVEVERYGSEIMDLCHKLTEKYEKLVAEENGLYTKFSNSQIINKGLTEKRNAINVQIMNLSTLEVDQRCDKCGSLITAENVGLFLKEKSDDFDAIVIALSDAEKLTGDINRELNNKRSSRKEFKIKLDKCKEDMIVNNGKRDDIISSKSAQENMLRDMELRKNKLENKISGNRSIMANNAGQIDRHQANINAQGIILERLQKEKEKSEVELLNVQLHMDGIASELEIYEFWKVAFSPKGVKSLLLDKFCNDINVIINECLSMISSGVMSIDVKPTATTKVGEERNKLGIDIMVGGDVVKYESLSGGEKKRIDFSMCMALNLYVSNKYGIKNGLLGIVILDELFSYLDKSGEESIGQYLHNESKNKAVLVITHTDELSSYADSVWTVIKSDGISKLVIN